ncbi:DUF3299 domain-containing protein [Vibrio cyclitrophicus]|uniref:DUF3299 domain-containing protein n=1 Tax=Vibrio cyclitrophicus TaxID=47951 RepID=UPI0021C3AFF0|nr:DUF3299 domain-containing protein [Vibrio cyclitrophicus]
MISKWITGILIAVFGFSVQAIAVASDLKELSWGDLIPQQEQYDDPFRQLSSKQLYELSLVANYKQQVTSGEALSQDSQEMFNAAMTSLAAQHIDVDALIAQRDIIANKRKAASESLDVSLDKGQVRIPGYLLPLEYSNTKVTEFLLVPTVGACIHIPPPPPNQMVFVKYPNGVEISSLYTPVWVEGQITVGNGQSELYLADGSDQVTFGYSIQALEVESYQ